jgi:hypothetical protein
MSRKKKFDQFRLKPRVAQPPVIPGLRVPGDLNIRRLFSITNAT